jgi:hypothetical protein
MKQTISRRGWSTRLLMIALVAAPAALAQDAPPVSKSTVGMPARIEQRVLEGSELEVRPIDDRMAPIVLRILGVYPHGTAFRYDFVYYGLDPGTYDLKDLLRRKDGSPTAGLPPIPVRIEPLLPPGQFEPHPLSPSASPGLGGYRLYMLIGGLAWLFGLAAILLVRRGKHVASGEAAGHALTLADRLKPLVDKAVAGELGAGEQAELERLLIGYWRRRLKLEDAPPAKLITRLRDHDEAGPLLRRLEDWLHRPPGTVGPVDVTALLKPYQAIAADDLEAAELASARPEAHSSAIQEHTR